MNEEFIFLLNMRILRELHELQRDSTILPNELLCLEPETDDDLSKWRSIIRGPKGSPFEGGTFLLKISIPDQYPMVPPKVYFATKICHPNIHFKDGSICMDVLKTEWTPAWTLRSLCLAIVSFLAHPEPESPYNCDCANLLRHNDKRGYESLVKMYTSLHSISK